jgi:hypothetical protein
MSPVTLSAARRTDPLLTTWGQSLDPDHPLPDYPRPQLRRASYLNLNGRWDYAFRLSSTEPDTYDGAIVVPFSPESALSGVGRQLQPGEKLHYRRTFTLPEGFTDDRVILHFGAVDQWCRVSVNGRSAGESTGGYLPFSLDITDLMIDGTNTLHVLATDPSDTGTGARGKQRLQPGGIWYTAQSGIWQTVWLESVPDTHVTQIRLQPDLAWFDITVDTSRPTHCDIEVSLDDRTVARASTTDGRRTRIDIPGPRTWTPANPVLYDVRIRAGRDAVDSYVGLRTFAVAPDADGTVRLHLNDRPYYHAGVLDQGYWPDGLYTAPSDEAMVHDIRTMKDLGFTMLRKHIKVEPLRWYYHCDRLGMLVWQDMVNGGGPYKRRVVQAPAAAPLHLDDRRHRAFCRQDPAGREQWLNEMEQTVHLLGNVAGLAVWVPFNEGWGQFDAAAVAARIRQLDPSRAVDHASGWHDQGAGDITSLHVYFRPFRMPRRARPDRAVALTEYGGYSLHVDDHSWSDQAFGYRTYDTVDELTQAFVALHDEQILPAIPRGLSASVYTQVSDVEDETNGLMTYDRRVLKMPAERVREVIAQLRLTETDATPPAP